MMRTTGRCWIGDPRCGMLQKRSISSGVPMSAIVANPIEISLPPPSLTKFERERAAFERLLPSLLNSYRGQYVAIHNGQVADHGSNRLNVALRLLKQIGSV